MNFLRNINYRRYRANAFFSWFIPFLLGTFLVTGMEFFIVNRKNGILTGGFLAEPIKSGFEISLLVLTVLIANAAVVSSILLPVYMLAKRMKWPLQVTMTLCMFFGFMPVILTDFLWYQISKYFGNTVSFFLLKTLSNDSFLTMVVQSQNHLFWLIIGIVSAFFFTSVCVRFWLIFCKKNMISLKKRGGLFVLGLMVCAMVMVAATALKNDQLNASLVKFPASRIMLNVLGSVTDWDRDGYSLFGIPRDHGTWNSSIYPYAIDIPGNGVDENGIMGDLPASSILSEKEVPLPRFKQRPNLVIFVLESCRADVIFKKVKGQEITPNINRLAEQGVFAKRAFCHNGYTIGGLNAIFCGDPLNRIASSQSLFDDFKANGYETACFSGENEAFGAIEKTTGMERVDFFYDARQDKKDRSYPFASAASLTVPGKIVHKRLASFLEQRRDKDRPLFLYVNLQDAHFPYHHYAMEPILTKSLIARSEIRPKNSKAVELTYLNAIANVDAVLNKMLTTLEKEIQGELAVIVVADHGESLFDHGFLGHGHTLNDIQTHIPLIVKGIPAVIEEPFGQTDIRTMILKALSLPPAAGRKPRRIDVAGKKVFQYIGTIARPLKIGWVDFDNRWSIDLRNFQKSFNNEPWKKQYTGTDTTEFSSLIYHWESLQQLSLKRD